MDFETYSPILNIGGLFFALNFYFAIFFYAAILIVSIKFLDRLNPKLKDSYKDTKLEV